MSSPQLALFDMPAPKRPEMMRSAIIMGEYRLELRRVWDEELALLVVCMLNPSTADSEQDDMTILALIHFAQLWGFGGLLIVNLCSYRTPYPGEMEKAADPVGPYNDNFLAEALGYARDHGRMALAAWGNGGEFMGRDKVFVEMAKQRGVDLVCLGTTQSGQPKHPLARGKHRIPRDQQPIIWRSAA